MTLIILRVLRYLLLVEHSREVSSGVECLSWKDEKVKPERLKGAGPKVKGERLAAGRGPGLKYLLKADRQQNRSRQVANSCFLL